MADVAYYYGEQIPKFASGSKYIRKTLGKGYDYDDINKEVLLQSTVTDAGHLQLPSGMTYQLLVLPQDDAQMSLEVLQKIEYLLENGATILGDKPKSVLGLKDYAERNAQLAQRADKIWNVKGEKQMIRHGRGTLFTGHTEKEILLAKGIVPDFQYTSREHVNLDYIHRQTATEDVYFIRNQDSLAIDVLVSLRVTGAAPYTFDPEHGTIDPVLTFSFSDNHISLPLQMEPWGSVFIVLKHDQKPLRSVVSITKNGQNIPDDVATSLSLDGEGGLFFKASQPGSYTITYADNNYETLNYSTPQEKQILNDSWDVHFPHGWGFEPIQHFDSLINWVDHAVPELSIFSGSATYKKSFILDKEFLSDGVSYVLDLGTVGEVAQVFLNGHEVGTKVFPPFKFDITGLLRTGHNHLSIAVANTWLNQLIGEAQKPLHQQRTRSNLSGSKADLTKRPWSNYKPQASGLIGPVIISGQTKYRLPRE
ncbi:MAG: hypothetical protein HKN76_09480 [Saprospiraceae bacterium]|nr:hypothetical protein [Saprospiraceae bacterium]